MKIWLAIEAMADAARDALAIILFMTSKGLRRAALWAATPYQRGLLKSEKLERLSTKNV